MPGTRVCIYCGKRPSDYRFRHLQQLQLHRFPKERDRCLKWLDILNFPLLYKKTPEQLYTKSICSEHFSLNQYNSNEPTSRLRHDAWPDLIRKKGSTTTAKIDVQCPPSDNSLPAPGAAMSLSTRVQTSRPVIRLAETPEAPPTTTLSQIPGKFKVLRDRDGSQRTFMILNKSSFRNLKENGVIQAVKKRSRVGTPKELEVSEEELDEIQYRQVLHPLDLDEPEDYDSTPVRLSALAGCGDSSGDSVSEVTCRNQTSNQVLSPELIGNQDVRHVETLGEDGGRNTSGDTKGQARSASDTPNQALNPALFVKKGVTFISQPPLFALNLPGSSTSSQSAKDSLGWNSDTEDCLESQKPSPPKASKSQGVSSSDQVSKAKEMVSGGVSPSSSKSAPDSQMLPTRFLPVDNCSLATKTFTSLPNINIWDGDHQCLQPAASVSREEINKQCTAQNIMSEEVKAQRMAHTAIVTKRHKELKMASSDLKKKYQKLMHKHRVNYKRLLRMYRNLESKVQEVQDISPRHQILKDAKDFLSEEHVLFLESQMFIRNRTGKGNKFSKKFIKYLIGLYERSPVGYRFLRTIFHIPTIKTIEKLRTRDFELLEEGPQDIQDSEMNEVVRQGSPQELTDKEVEEMSVTESQDKSQE